MRAGLFRLGVALLLLSACERPLGGAGSFSARWIQGSTTTSTTFLPVAPGDLVSSGSVEWMNDRLGAPGSDDPVQVTRAVWSRSSGREAFVQASRYEIAAALPRIEVPRMVPAEVRHITSQLVYATESGALGDRTAAAFGFWAVEPYSISRSVGQRSALLVGLADGLPLPGSDIPACQGYELGEGVLCEMTDVSGTPAWRVQTEGARRLVWAEGPYRYELECHDELPGGVCEQVAASMMALEDIGGPTRSAAPEQ